MNKAPQPPLEYLASASQSSLEGLELARLSLISRLRSEIQQALEDWITAEVDARLARRLSAQHALHDALLLCPSDPTLPQPSATLSPPRSPHQLPSASRASQRSVHQLRPCFSQTPTPPQSLLDVTAHRRVLQQLPPAPQTPPLPALHLGSTSSAPGRALHQPRNSRHNSLKRLSPTVLVLAQPNSPRRNNLALAA